MSEADDIRIQDYEDWMKPQVVQLFASEYGRDPRSEATSFTNFYEHPFQRREAIMLAALDGDRVAGFQSYFYWPYREGARQLRSFQSGRSLVSSEYRGRRIFARLLRHLEEHPGDRRIDLLMGFPVEMSFGSFLRNGWANPTDLRWYARVLHPLSVVSTRQASPQGLFDAEPEVFETEHPEGLFSLSKSADFADWRSAYSADRNYRYFHYGEAGRMVRFDLKLNRRGRINELVLGDVVASEGDGALLGRAMREFLRGLRGHRRITMVSIARNSQLARDPLHPVLLRKGFVKLRPRIHFIVKNLGAIAGAEDASRWRLFRADIDTW